MPPPWEVHARLQSGSAAPTDWRHGDEGCVGARGTRGTHVDHDDHWHVGCDEARCPSRASAVNLNRHRMDSIMISEVNAL